VQLRFVITPGGNLDECATVTPIAAGKIQRGI
jgi:hypothetical protein